MGMMGLGDNDPAAPAPTKKWYEVFNDITAGASDLVSSFKNTGYDSSVTPGANDPDPKPKSNTTKYVLIGSGVLAAAFVTYMIVKKKKKS